MKRFAAGLRLAGWALAGVAQQDDSAAAAANDLQVRVERDLAYGPSPQQRLDVYLPGAARAQGAQPWRGTVSLDSAAMDVPALMQARHLPLYDRAFGGDPADWRSASPGQRFTSEAPPILAVCSTLRRDSCPRAEELRATAARWRRTVQVQGVAKTHAQVDHDLGLPGPYSDSVDRWISSIL